MDNIFYFRVRKSNVWRVILDVNPGNHYQSHEFNHIYQIIVGIVDKNYLNRVGQKVKNDLSKQPCGCDCNCRPKFEDDGTPIPCNCKLNSPYFVGDWSDGRGIFSTPQIFIPEFNCPVELSFTWTNQSFVSVAVTLKTSTQVIPMTEGQQYSITLNPGQWFFFSFSSTQQAFDQILTIECENITCAENYGQVGSYTLIGI